MANAIAPKVQAVESMVKRAWEIFRSLILLTATLAGVTACSAREPATVSLTGIVYNYSQDSIASVTINGKSAGSVIVKTENGGVSGGSGVCCFDLPIGAKQVDVMIQSSGGDYKTTATIEKWWPDLAHYGVVHILPGRKVVMQVTPSYPAPRKDLLEAQQQELGMEKKVLFDIWSSGPRERIDGKQ
ncbi:hypothetical protein [Azonexus sp.]|jgi:hypothetical protein|uniref:hypothetical protein n=1 Tax=Azonexus sp. TaxID=1872668 RepID=UPI002821CC90|nr:hypothetical protein [Azonexus sp.]MDR1995321.1 DUF3304 domain-containing protein [Azonexus sp.]